MAERLDALNRIITESQEWVAFSRSDIWLKLKERIAKEVIEPATMAFHATNIENQSNEQILRHMLSQRTTVRVAQKILNIVEAQPLRLKTAQEELDKINNKAKGGTK